MIIVYCANQRIYQQLPTTINSLIKNNSNIEKIYLLIEDDEIPYINYPLIEFINCKKFDFLEYKGMNCTKHFPYMAMVRCYLAKILKEDKVLYMDVDTIVDTNIEDLWNFDLKDNYIAMREEGGGYYNSGVILFNLKKIRETSIDDTLIKLLKGCKFVFPDQDAMNIVFKNNIGNIDAKYNALGRDDVYGTEIAIRHYAGITKPWKEKASEQDKAFWNKYKIEELIYF